MASIAQRSLLQANLPEDVSEFAAGKLASGLLCYWRPDESGFTAICVDLNIYAFGETVKDAKSNLHFVIVDTLEIAAENGALDELLQQGPSPSTLWAYRVTRFAYMVAFGVVHVVIWVIRLVTMVKNICYPKPPFGTWQEHHCPQAA